MSAIFGLVYLDGRPVPPERLEAMRRALDGWGPDGLAVCSKGCAGLGFAHLRTTPEGHHERMPWTDGDSGELITAAARLDNRDDLCDLFRIPLSERSSMPDGRLVAMSFARYGQDAPPQLFGDWSFAAWDEKHRRLFVARDHLGNTGLFYCYKPPVFAFASSLKALLVLPEVSRTLNERHLARYLTLLPGGEENWAQTFWEDIRSLLPAHCLIVTPQALRLRKYWRIDDAPRVRLGSDAAYVEGFLAHFRQAVQVRLRTDRPIGSQLSAGLDSGSVTCLAAEALRAAGKPLPAFTSVPLYPAEQFVPGALADEWPLADKVAQRYDNIWHIPIRAAGVSPLKSLDDGLSLFGSPILAVTNFFWLQALHEEARRRGIGVLLTGQMGNCGVSWNGGRHRIYFDLIQGRFARGVRSLRAYRATRGVSWYRTLRRHLLSPLLGPIWRLRRRIRHPVEHPWGDYSIINSAFAQRMDLKRVIDEEKKDIDPGRPRTPEWEHRRTLEGNAPLLYAHHHFGAAAQMEVRDPTADVRFLMFCFGVPDDQWARDGGERMLLRRSMTGILPDEVRLNLVQGRQAADLGLRVMDYRREMEAELQSLEANGLVTDYVDCGVLREAWRSLLSGCAPHSSLNAALGLLRGVMAGHFIIHLSNGHLSKNG